MAHLIMIVDDKKRALDRILKAKTLHLYFKKYKYAEHCMKAVKEGLLDLGPGIPTIICDKIEQELSPPWVREAA
jgi:hypothetical protein